MISKTNGKDNQLKKKFSRLELLAQLKGSKTSVSSIRKVRFEDDVHLQNAASLKKSLKQKQEMSHFCEEGLLVNIIIDCYVFLIVCFRSNLINCSFVLLLDARRKQ